MTFTPTKTLAFIARLRKAPTSRRELAKLTDKMDIRLQQEFESAQRQLTDDERKEAFSVCLQKLWKKYPRYLVKFID